MKNIQLFLHKLTNWEYWPFQIVYIPIYFQYIYYVVRTRSFFYFNASNPTIRNGGFFMESKKEIYDLIPQKYYPKTILIENKTPIDFISELIKLNNISFPLICKPNVGLRGTAVKKISNTKELTSYASKANFDFLVQDFIPYANEIGLFYVKLPNEKFGKITGIVAKEFLILIGNGKNTIKELLEKEAKHLYLL